MPPHTSLPTFPADHYAISDEADEAAGTFFAARRSPSFPRDLLATVAIPLAAVNQRHGPKLSLVPIRNAGCDLMLPRMVLTCPLADARLST